MSQSNICMGIFRVREIFIWGFVRVYIRIIVQNIYMSIILVDINREPRSRGYVSADVSHRHRHLDRGRE